MPIFVNVDDYKNQPLCAYIPAYECKDCHKAYLNGNHCPKCGSKNRREIFTTVDRLKEE